MAKGGKSNSGAGVTQKHLHSRISYLYQAAIYLDTARNGIERHVLKTPEADQGGLEEVRGLKGQSATAEAVDSRARSKTANTINILGSNSQRQPQMEPIATDSSSSQSQRLLTSMRSISQKSQIRLSRSIKRSVCRRCNSLLILNNTAEIENLSRERRKPWADVLVVRCGLCDYVKRYPVGMMEERERKRKKVNHAASATK
jgi:ribonuclease P protein subunit RPR2